MPKMKSHSGAKKRFTFNAAGKARRKYSHKNHINIKMGSDRIRRLRGTVIVSDPDQRHIDLLLPYGGR